MGLYIKDTTKKWSDLIDDVLSLRKISLVNLQNLLKDTYLLLSEYHKDNLVPKQISKMLLTIEEFLYFVEICSEDFDELGMNSTAYYDIISVVTALKKGFFNGKYEYDFPQLGILTLGADGMNEKIIDFEKDIFN